MNWKQLFLPQPVHSAFKHARRLKTAIMKPWLTLLLRLGWPRPAARELAARRFKSRVVRKKQGILGVVAEGRFLRFATNARGIVRLEREFAMWNLLRENGLAAILPRFVVLHDRGSMKILETELLQPIRKEDHAAVSLPIIEALMAAARPVVPGKLPAEIEAGLQFARDISGGVLPSSFASESDIRDAFARPLMTGISHQDLHYRNAMRDADGRPVLIDLKSCGSDRIVSMDLLVLACKYLQAQGRQTMLDAAYSGQQQNWRITEVEPILTLVDLPRLLWGQILALRFIGLSTLRRDPTDINPLFQKLLMRVLDKDWRVERER